MIDSMANKSFWLEINNHFYDREGIYLVCPIHSDYVKNHNNYKIMLEPRRGDIVFHYFVYQNSLVNVIKSYSFVENQFYISNEPDKWCKQDPPYRKIELEKNVQFTTPITYQTLVERRKEIEHICDYSELTRTPFDKNFKFKQMYLTRVPRGLAEIFIEIGTKAS